MAHAERPSSRQHESCVAKRLSCCFHVYQDLLDLERVRQVAVVSYALYCVFDDFGVLFDQSLGSRPGMLI
jgi:hypothetical protein